MVTNLLKVIREVVHTALRHQCNCIGIGRCEHIVMSGDYRSHCNGHLSLQSVDYNKEFNVCFVHYVNGTVEPADCCDHYEKTGCPGKAMCLRSKFDNDYLPLISCKISHAKFRSLLFSLFFLL